MTKATKQALLARYEDELDFLDLLIDLNVQNEEAVEQFQKKYRKITELLTELAETKASDE